MPDPDRLYSTFERVEGEALVLFAGLVPTVREASVSELLDAHGLQAVVVEPSRISLIPPSDIAEGDRVGWVHVAGNAAEDLNELRAAMSEDRRVASVWPVYRDEEVEHETRIAPINGIFIHGASDFDLNEWLQDWDGGLQADSDPPADFAPYARTWRLLGQANKPVQDVEAILRIAEALNDLEISAAPLLVQLNHAHWLTSVVAPKPSPRTGGRLFSRLSPTRGGMPAPSATGPGYHRALTHLAKAWECSKGKPEIRVAVVDNGVDPDHPCLVSSLLEQDLWYRTVAVATNKVIITKGDVDEGTHGTMSAGLIAGSRFGNEVPHDVGFAPNTTFFPIQIGDDGISANGAGKGAGGQQFLVAGPELCLAVRWAYHQDARVVYLGLDLNLPGGYEWLSDLYLETAEGDDMVLVAPSGNYHLQPNHDVVAYPARSPHVIGVGGSRVVGDTEEVMPDSQSGPGLDLVAPGVFIETTDVNPPGQLLATTFSGTSAAAPQVAGAAALVLARSPKLNLVEVRRILTHDAVPLPDKSPTGKSRAGAGRLSLKHICTQQLGRILAVEDQGDTQQDPIESLPDPLDPLKEEAPMGTNSNCCDDRLAAAMMGVLTGYLAGRGCGGTGVSLSQALDAGGTRPTRVRPQPDAVVGVVWEADSGCAVPDSGGGLVATLKLTHEDGNETTLTTDSQGVFQAPLSGSGSYTLEVTQAPSGTLICGSDPLTFTHSVGSAHQYNFGYHQGSSGGGAG